VPLSTPANHKCMYCGIGMHGALCGKLYCEDIATNKSFIDPSRGGLPMQLPRNLRLIILV